MSPKMKRLADAFLVPGTTQTAAAIQAGYPARSATTQANYVLNLPHVAKYVRERQAKVQAKHDITLDKVIAEFAKIGFANMDDYVTQDENGQPRFRLLGEIGRDKLSVVTELTVDTRKEFEGRGEDREQVATVERIRFKLADKVKALDALGRNLGMFPREAQRSEEDDGGLNVTITVKGGLPKFPAKKTKSE